MTKTNWTNWFAVGCLLATGCATEGADPGTECDLPGDVDCSDDPVDPDGKADGWDPRNDPGRLARNLNYRLAELPRDGRIERDVWAASYWPTYEGSTNYRWQGASVLSPMEKYDNAFNGWTPDTAFASEVPRDCGDDANEKFNEYRASLGPAAKWQTSVQGRDRMYDGVDSDDDGDADECSDYDGIGTWWGYCPGWTAAAILNPEPLHAVEHNGVRFEVSDIKALLIGQYEGANAKMLGGRCNLEDVERDDTGRVIADECRDTNAGAWHVIVTNFLGVNKQPFAEDRTGGIQVWNQPVVAYEITELDEITVARAHELLGVTGDTYKYNPDAVALFEVRLTTDYITEGSQSTQPLGMDNYIRNDRYHYLLEINDDGKIIGGEWLGSSRGSHPDFLWVPTSASRWSWSANPSVDLDEVELLLEKSRADVEPEPTEGTTYSNDTDVSIPDNDPAGVTTSLSVNDSQTIGSLTVAVDIEHTYVGDLVVTVEHNGQRRTLHDREGGSQNDLVKLFTIDDFDGQSAGGEWTLQVTDLAAVDTGTIRKFSVIIAE